MAKRAPTHSDEKPGDLRLTPQRMAILEVLRHTGTRPGASWLYQEVRKKLPHISLGTVYRNLTELAEAGLVLEIDVGQGASRWDACTEFHYHVVCVRCGKIVDLEIESLAGYLERKAAKAAHQSAKASGFTILGHCLHFQGICPECRANDSDVHKSLDDVS